jgi:hypothetical protein
MALVDNPRGLCYFVTGNEYLIHPFEYGKLRISRTISLSCSRKEKRFLHSKEKGDKGKFPLAPSYKRGVYGQNHCRRYSGYA